MTIAYYRRLHLKVSVLVVIFLSPVLSLESTIQGAPRNVQVAFAATNNTGKQKTDLDLIYRSDTNMTVSALNVAVQPVTLQQPTYTITGNGTRTVTVRFDGTFPPSATVDVTITFKQEESNIVRVESKWTPPGSPDDIPVLGFQVDAAGNYRIFNDSAYDVSIRGLSVKRNVAFQSNDQLAARLAGREPSTEKTVVTVRARQSIHIGRFPTRVGAYLYSTFDAQFIRTMGQDPPLSTAAVIHGHEGIKAGAAKAAQ